MYRLLASAALAVLLSTSVQAQVGGGNGCDNKGNPACSKSAGAPSGTPGMVPAASAGPRMHHRHHRYMRRHRHTGSAAGMAGKKNGAGGSSKK